MPVKQTMWFGQQFQENLEAKIKSTLPELADDTKEAVKDIAPVETGDYRESIEGTVKSDGLGFGVGSPKKEGQYLLGLLLEYGTDKMPAQPHYSTVFNGRLRSMVNTYLNSLRR